MQIVDSKYNPYLSNLFNSSVLKEFASHNRSELFQEVIEKSNFINKIDKNSNLSDIYDNIYRYLVDNYRSEYIYKNAIALKILLGRHSLNTSTLLTELRVGSSKADVVILNGSSNVYEIKTEYDTLDKLYDQIESYLNMFEYVNVVTHLTHLEKIKAKLNKRVGILLLSKSFSLQTIRKPISNRQRVNPSLIFDTFRKSEYLKALLLINKNIPNVPNTQLFKECKNIFKQLSPLVAHDIMVRVLSERIHKKTLSDSYKKVPKSLTHSWLVSALTPNERNNFIRLLNTSFYKLQNSNN